MDGLEAYARRWRPAVRKELRRQTDSLPDVARPLAEQVLGGGGKLLRPLLLLLFARAAGGEEKEALPVAAAIELLHCATLLHDDVMDNAPLRRGQPAAHTVFGATRAILGGDALLALANLVVARHDATGELTRLLSGAIMETTAGQLREMAHAGDASLTYETYLEIIGGKTAALISASCALGALLGGGGRERAQAAAEYGRCLGLGFQMVDDALDFSRPEITGKPCGGDVREYKCTLPLLFYFQSLNAQERDALGSAFARRDMGEARILALVDDVRGRGFAGRAREEAAAWLERAVACLAAFPESPATGALADAAAFIGCRNA